MADADVLIIGAGIAGMTLAACLQRAGVTAEVAERAEGLRATGCGILLHPNALSHLDYLGPRLLDIGTFITKQVTTDPDGRFTEVDWARVWDGRLPLAVHRHDLAELMLGALAPGSVRWGTEPRILGEQGGAVVVALDDDIRRYSLTVGADGVHSATRQLVAPGARPRTLGQKFWRSTARSRVPLALPEWRVWRDGTRFFGVMPLGGGLLHVFFQSSLEDPPQPANFDHRAEMSRLTGGLGGAVTEVLAQLTYGDAIDVRVPLGIAAPRWTLGRMGIMGDAAHAVSPATTQGAGLAIGDAAILASEIERYGPSAAALSAFESRRRPQVSAFLQRARLHATLMGNLHRNDLPTTARALNRDSTRYFRQLYAPLRQPA